MLHKSDHIDSEYGGENLENMAAEHKPDTIKQLLRFFFFNPFCAASVELIEKVNAFSSVSTPVTIQDSFGSLLGVKRGGRRHSTEEEKCNRALQTHRGE